MCPSVGLTCTIAFVSNVDWRLCKEQRGIAPHIKQPWAWNPKFTCLPLPRFLVYCPTTRSPNFLSYCTNGLVTILSLSPQFSSAPDAISKLHPGAQWKNRLASSQTHQRTRQVGTPFYTWARLLFSSSCIRSFHHTFPQSTEMLCGGEFLFSTHHWGDMWLTKMMHLTCSGWKHSVM